MFASVAQTNRLVYMRHLGASRQSNLTFLGSHENCGKNVGETLEEKVAFDDCLDQGCSIKGYFRFPDIDFVGRVKFFIFSIKS